MIILPILGNSLCLLNVRINSNKTLRLGKNLQNWENTGLFWIGKQPVFGCKIGKIKSLMLEGHNKKVKNSRRFIVLFHQFQLLQHQHVKKINIKKCVTTAYLKKNKCTYPGLSHPFLGIGPWPMEFVKLAAF